MSAPVRLASPHGALFYDGSDEFAALVPAYLRDGMELDERLLVLADRPRLELVREALGGDAAHVELEEAGERAAGAGRATRRLLDHVARCGDAQRARVVSDPSALLVPAVRRSDHLRADSAANAVFASLPLSILCAYDAGALPGEVLSECRCTHPFLLGEDGERPSASYLDPEVFLRSRSPVTAVPAGAARFSCQRPVDLRRARAFLRALLPSFGLPAAAIEFLLVAVDEILANALLHGAPPRRLAAYREGAFVVCHVEDGGSGPPSLVRTYLPPDPDSSRGRGLWLAREACDSVEVASDPDGTHVRLLVALPSAA